MTPSAGPDDSGHRHKLGESNASVEAVRCLRRRLSQQEVVSEPTQPYGFGLDPTQRMTHLLGDGLSAPGGGVGESPGVVFLALRC